MRKADSALPNSTAAFFDFDNTLLKEDSAKIGIKYLYERKELSLFFVLRVVFWNSFFKRDKLSAMKMANLLYSFYPGRDISKFIDNAADYYRQMLRPHLAPNIMNRLEEHRRDGVKLVILSASPSYILDIVKDDLALDAVLATQLSVDESGVCRGIKDDFICIDANKAIAAKRWASEHDIDLAHSYAYGDHLSDVPMLEMVGHPYAVEPKPALLQVAKRRGWPVLFFD